MDWRAKWIWARSHLETPDCYLYSRKEIEFQSAAQAVAFVTCSSEYKLYVNGRYIGRGPGPCQPTFRYYDEYDLTRILRPGKNCIAAICYNHGGDGGFLLQIDLTHDGESVILGTDDTWKVKPADDWDFNSVRLSNGTGYQEVYDCGRKPVGWNVVGFDDSEWDDAYVIGEVARRSHEGFALVHREIPPLREWEVSPARVIESGVARNVGGVLGVSGSLAVVGPGSTGRLTLDFEREIVGFPVLRIADSGYAVVDIGYGRSLAEEGGAIDRDRFILRGGRRELQTFGRRAFRYLWLTFRELDGPVHLESVSVVRIGYPVEQVSAFECSDERLSEVWRTGVHTLGLQMQDSYEGCAREQALANYYCFFDAGLAAKTLRESARLRDWDLAWVLMLHDYYLYTGDKLLVAELYQSLRQLLEECELSEDDLRGALYYQALRDAAKLASAVGEIEDAITWHDRAEQAVDSSADLDAQTLMGPFYALQAMLRLGREDECMRMIRESSGDERASIAAVHFLPAEGLGVKPSLPESGVVTIQPRVGDLRWARGTLKTQRCVVEVEWRSEPGRFTIEIDAPEGFIVGLPIGAFRSPRIEEIDLSPETPERRVRRAYGWGSVIWRNDEERDPYVDWLRTQEEEPPEDYISRRRCEVDGGYVWVRESLLTHVRYEVTEAT